MKEERWLPIEGYEGLYEVSSEGRVRSLNYKLTGKMGILKGRISKNRYLQVILSKDGKTKQFSIHRLVAVAFVPNMFGLNEVNHINEDKTDNRADNLMWCDRKENDNWGTRNQRVSEKLTNGKCSKSVFQYTLNGELIKEWPSISEIHRVLGLSITTISRCCYNRIKSAYDFVWKFS